MPRYVSLHALGCLPRPALASLCQKLFAAQPPARRVIAGQIGEKLLVEFDAPDEPAASAWLATNRLRPLWLLRLDFESTDGSVRDVH
jgi:hypothetical protein